MNVIVLTQWFIIIKSVKKNMVCILICFSYSFYMYVCIHAYTHIYFFKAKMSSGTLWSDDTKLEVFGHLDLGSLCLAKKGRVL